MRIIDLVPEIKQRSRTFMTGQVFDLIRTDILFPSEKSESKLSIRKSLQLIRRILAYLSTLGFPRIALSKEEVTTRKAVRQLPESVTFDLPAETISGTFISGRTPDGNKRIVQVFSRYLKPGSCPVFVYFIILSLALSAFLVPNTLSPILLVLAAFAFSRTRSAWSAIHFILLAVWIVVAAGMLFLIPRMIQSGMDPDLIRMTSWGLGIFFISFVLWVSWRKSETRGFFGFSGFTPDSLAICFLKPSEKIRYSVFSSFNIMTAGLAILMFSALWLMKSDVIAGFKPALASALNSPVVAFTLYDDLADQTGDVEAAKRYRMEAAHDLVLSIEANTLHGHQDVAFGFISKLPAYLPYLSPEDKGIIAASIYRCADDLASFNAPSDSWIKSTNLFKFLLLNLPESRESALAAERSLWRLAGIKNLAYARRFAGYKVPVDLREEMEESVVWYTAKPDQCFLFITADLAHMGRRSKELLNTHIRGKTDSGKPVSCLGFYDKTGLSKVQYFDGISVGPDVLTVTMVLEVPSQDTTLELKLGNESHVSLNYTAENCRDILDRYEVLRE